MRLVLFLIVAGVMFAVSGYDVAQGTAHDDGLAVLVFGVGLINLAAAIAIEIRDKIR